MEPSDKYIELGVASEKHALRIMDIKEIIKIQPITYVPNSSSVALGVINLRGTVIPVLSLRSIFGLPEVEHTKATRIVVVLNDDQMIGLVVDSVSRVVIFSDIQPPPETVGDAALSFVAGVGRVEDRLVMVMNLSNVLKSNS